MKIKTALVATLACMSVATAHAGAVIFNTSGLFTWQVPAGVTVVNALVVGGGGGGASGHQGGGGAGFLAVGTYAVTAGDLLSITVGAGGSGAQSVFQSNNIVGNSAGFQSKFGNFLTSSGGGTVTTINGGGQNGSSGGGAACNAGSQGGKGGSGGANGQACQSGGSMPIGTGQGSYASLLSLFTEHLLTAGAGGDGGVGTHAGGGGGGGILIDGAGLAGQNGVQAFSGKGGVGYGAGGGAGGFNSTFDSGTRWGGGAGASGLVYLEFVQPAASNVPEPGSVALVAGAMLGLAVVRSRRKSQQPG